MEGEETAYRLVRYILLCEQKKKVIKKEDLTSKIEGRGNNKKYMDAAGKILEDVFRFRLVEIADGSKEGKKRYVLQNILERTLRNRTLQHITDETHWTALTVVCLIVLGGGKVEEEKLVRLVKKTVGADSAGETIKWLRKAKYIEAVVRTERDFGERETHYVLGGRSLVEFTEENILDYVKEICLDEKDEDCVLKIENSVLVGASLSGIRKKKESKT
ncbi:MAG: uncharacterized protein A8A55_2308 [Amphiamblys sp. WSBS2006]|nr:MAG: uncharacterized protein A8A55_2308 [Amphiamblys sp. WSBS2006]